MRHPQVNFCSRFYTLVTVLLQLTVSLYSAAQRQKKAWLPLKKRITLSKVGLGAAQGQRSFSGLHKVGIPKHHRKKREKEGRRGREREEKVCYNEGHNTVANV